nr:helix-turn-helix domain-containing protein [Paenibacillus baekrokdamisoli]
MLTQQLRELEEDGVILRETFDQHPLKVEYSLTEYGRSLTHILDVLLHLG